MDTGYLSQQVNTIIGQLHGLFDEIGVPNHDREKREEHLFEALSKALTDQVRLVTSEKEDMVEEASRIITTIQQMEASLDDNRTHRDRHDDLQITYPLTRCLQSLKERHKQVARSHKERFEQVKKLVEALESYSSHLEATFVQIPLPPTGPNQSIPPNFDLSPSYVDKLDHEFTRVYEEYTRRVATVKALCEHIIQLWAELGTPQAQTDGAIVKYYRDSPEQLGLHQEDIERLRAKRDKLSDEKKNREKRLRELRAAVEALWEKLEVDMGERKAFLNSNRGCGVRQINEFEDELNRLNELKRQNLHLFVEDARYKLQELWDALYLSEDEMLEFTPAFSDVYSDALLEAHEREIQRLEALKEQRAPTLELVDRHKSLTHERNELAASSQDASRLMLRGQKGEKRDPGKLLREEKMRKRIAKELPKITVDLRRVLEQFEDEFGRPFLVHGERYLDVIEAEDRPAPGPRSKTPGAGAAAPASMTRPKGHARANSTAGSTTGIARPPTRNGARTPAPAPSVKRNTNNMNSAVQPRPLSAHAKSQEILRPGSAMGTVRERAQTLNRPPGSPSRIPARPPLTNLKYGTNSPERQLDRPASRMDGYATIRGGAPMRAPPPKMRDLNMVELETPVNPYKMAGLGGSIVRQVELEDPYDEDCQQPGLMRANSTLSHTSHASHASHASYASQSSHHSVGSSQHDYHSSTLRQYPPSSYSQAPPPRQISNSSNGSSNVTGSENWETYDDASEPEQDATDTYYAKVRAARGTRFEPEAASRPAANDAKRPPRPFPMMAPPGHVYSDGEGNRIISGSEWTDEDGY
ncbi:Microtubule associated protein [Colletotrichum higginsianum IMI 349063]|uniref:Microtubule associated protein n=1 Tax=Colletotrichum higginsianum (strain IMI 349063) TaxID=759273 RepID=A0A1B7YN22_COLHI|nr:Microtubule associated protein [Colletotrichum higginsianum IMI 349063]OBR13440.1 Microtubule associated protein [Colletotrichum higginsianum IMI 349063]GJC95887.1 microtubule associated protein [Colletotrichum higginsianum]